MTVGDFRSVMFEVSVGLVQSPTNQSVLEKRDMAQTNFHENSPIFCPPLPNITMATRSSFGNRIRDALFTFISEDGKTWKCKWRVSRKRKIWVNKLCPTRANTTWTRILHLPRISFILDNFNKWNKNNQWYCNVFCTKITTNANGQI